MSESEYLTKKIVLLEGLIDLYRFEKEAQIVLVAELRFELKRQSDKIQLLEKEKEG